MSEVAPGGVEVAMEPTAEELVNEYAAWCRALERERKPRTARELATVQTDALRAVVLGLALSGSVDSELIRGFVRLLRRRVRLYIEPEGTIRMHLKRLRERY